MRWNQLKVNKKRPVLLHSSLHPDLSWERLLEEDGLVQVLKEVGMNWKDEVQYVHFFKKKKKRHFNTFRKLKPKNAKYLSSVFFWSL